MWAAMDPPPGGPGDDVAPLSPLRQEKGIQRQKESGKWSRKSSFVAPAPAPETAVLAGFLPRWRHGPQIAACCNRVTRLSV
jgi:hypothetical protein